MESFEEKYNNLNDMYKLLEDSFEKLKFYSMQLEKNLLYFCDKYNINAKCKYNINLNNIFKDAMLNMEKAKYEERKKKREKEELQEKLKIAKKELG